MDESRADVASSGEQMDHPGRDAGVEERVDHEVCRQRPDLGGFDDHGVTGQEGRAGRPAGQRVRVVEGTDDRPHAIWAEVVARDLEFVESLHRLREAVVAPHGVGRVPDEIGGLLDLADGLQPVLPVLP